MSQTIRPFSFIFCLLVAFTIQTSSTKAKSLADGETGYVYYESYASDVTLEGKVELPDDPKGKLPAIILVHGSAGIGYREATWGEFFRDNGYVTMVINMFGPRSFRPMSGKNVGSYDDVFDAFNVLKTHPNVDPDQISVMGWSFGGGITVGAMSHTKKRGKGHVLKSAVGFYPVCGLRSLPRQGNKDMEFLLVIGTKDTYSREWQCKHVVDEGLERGRRARLIVYQGAYHGFDGNKNVSFNHLNFGKMTVKPDRTITEQARKDVLAFLKAVGTDQGIASPGNDSGGDNKPDGCKDPNFAAIFPGMCS